MTTTTEKSAFQPTLRIPFTDKTIKEPKLPAPPGKRRSILAEGEPHFLLRVTDKGSKTFWRLSASGPPARPVRRWSSSASSSSTGAWARQLSPKLVASPSRH